MRHGRLRSVALAALALAAIAARPQPAAAHAALASADPAPGATLAASPSAVTLAFTEDPERSLSLIRLLDSTGGEIVAGAGAHPAGRRDSLRLPIRRTLEKGVYTVVWRVVSRADGHATAGVHLFGVGVSPADAPPPSIPEIAPTRTSAVETTGRAAMLLGIVGMIGSAVARGRLFRERRPRADMVGLVSALAAGAGLGLLATAQRHAAGASLADLLGTPIGRSLLWRAAGIAAGLAAAVVAVTVAAAPRRLTALALGSGAAGALLAHVAAGHAAASSAPVLRTAAQWAHVGAAGVWLGGLAALLAGLRGLESDREGAVRRLSSASGVALFVVLGTGVLRALNELPSLGSLTSSAYGIAVLAKAAIMLALVGLGARNRYVGTPRAERSLGTLRRIGRAEVALAVAAVGAGALLASTAPPRAPAVERQAGVATAEGTDFATTVRVRLTASPGDAGLNTFTLSVEDFDSAAPVAGASVSLRFALPGADDVPESSLEMEPEGDGVYRATGGNIAQPGRWRVTVTIQQSGTAVEVPLRLGTRCRTGEVAAPGQPTLYTIPLGNGRSAQGYVDPGATGGNEVHATFFDAGGQELPIEGEVMIVATTDDETTTLPVRRLGPGHFVGDADLAAGLWRFDASAPAPGRGTLAGCFEETIR